MKSNIDRVSPYIAGVFKNDHYVSVSSFEGKVLGEAGISSKEDVIQALGVARSVQTQFVKSLFDDENIIINLTNIGLELRRRFRELTHLMCLETGFPISHVESLFSVAIDFASQAVSLYHKIKKKDYKDEQYVIPFSFLHPNILRGVTYRRMPRGVILAITPGNTPVPLIPIIVLSALFSGNAVVVKPSSKTILTALMLGEVASTVEPLPGLVNFINIPSNILYEYFHLVDCVHYTGGTKHAANIIEGSLSAGVDAFVEGEGNGLVVVDHIKDCQAVVETLVRTIVRCNGQLCTSPRGILIHQQVYQEIESALVSTLSKIRIGNPLDRLTQLGPLLSEQAVELAQKQIEESTKQGAQILIGGRKDGNFILPTILVGVTPEMRAFREEIFGPVVWLKKFSNLIEVRQILEAHRHGLCLTLFSDTPEKILSRLPKAVSMRICINADPTLQSAVSPWGAMKKSGISEVEPLMKKFTKKIIIVKEDTTGENKYNKAIVLEGPNKLTTKRFPLVKSTDQLITVQMLWSGICGTDKRVICGEMEANYPLVLGHENIGKVISLPQSSLNDIFGRCVLKGDIITWSAINPCNRCFFCRENKQNLCVAPEIFGMSHTTEISPYVFGGWSQYTYLSHDQPLLKLLPEMEREPASVMIETAAAAIRMENIVHRHWTSINLLKNLSMVVIGSGPVAILSGFIGKSLGFKKIVFMSKSRIMQFLDSVDINANIVDTQTSCHERITQVIGHMGGLGAGLVVEASGGPSSIKWAFDIVKPGGVVFEIGTIHSTQSHLDLSKIAKKDLTIYGAMGYTLDDFKRSSEFILTNLTSLRSLVSHVFSLAKYEQAVKTALSEDSCKVVFRCSEIN